MGLFQTQLPPNFGGPSTIRRHPLGTTGGRKAARELSSTANSKPLPQTLPAHIRTSLSSSLSLMMEVTLPLQPWPSSLRQLLEGSQPSARHPTVRTHPACPPQEGLSPFCQVLSFPTPPYPPCSQCAMKMARGTGMSSRPWY